MIFGGQAQRAVLRGRATFGLTAFALYEYLAGSYAFEQPILGGRLQVGAAAPVIATASMNVTLTPACSAQLSDGDRIPASATCCSPVRLLLELRRAVT